MPLLIKDNVNTSGMNTTAGSMALKNNSTTDAFIIKNLREKGAIILGKTNLSEWANFICQGCPNGFSALGGQTLNPYGRKKLDTGGSSSGSGVAVAANYAVAAVGTETSGSILSPSSSNSIVGLKPTIGLLSRSGIIPISSHLDTPGPMTKNVIDNAILLSAMVGYDARDSFSIAIKNQDYLNLNLKNLEGIRVGLNKGFRKDSLYCAAASELIELGADTMWLEPEATSLSGFIRLLRGDMKYDLSEYLENYSSSDIDFSLIEEIIDFNRLDSAQNIPYGQGQFYGILNETISKDSLIYLDSLLQVNGRKYLDETMNNHNLDMVLSF
jgi:amidase